MTKKSDDNELGVILLRLRGSKILRGLITDRLNAMDQDEVKTEEHKALMAADADIAKAIHRDEVLLTIYVAIRDAAPGIFVGQWKDHVFPIAKEVVQKLDDLEAGIYDPDIVRVTL